MPDTPLNPDALKVALEWLATAVREVEVKFADDGTRPGDYWTGYREAKNEIADLLAEPELIKKATRVALAAALPEVTSVEEFDQLPDDTVALDDAGAVLRKWTANEWYATGDDQSYMNTEIGLPARVLYRPEVKP